MERIFKDVETIRRFDEGVFASYIRRIVQQLVLRGYCREIIRQNVRVIDGFGRWLTEQGIAQSAITPDHERVYLAGQRRRRGPGKARALRRLVELLVEDQVIALAVPPKTEQQIVVDEFATFLDKQKGLAPRTIEMQSEVAARFLVWKFGKRTPRLDSIRARDLISFVHKEAVGKRRGTDHLRSGLRAFVRYLLTIEAIERDFSASIPAPRNYRLSRIPKLLTQDQVAAVLATCDSRTAIGRRDYAILLLLSRLGLRAAEVTRLTLDDINWDEGTISICGKTRTRSSLPLPPDVGDAIAVYLRNDRPKMPWRDLFLLHFAPFTGLARKDSVWRVAYRAIKRSGLSVKSYGTHQFRHTLATKMLAEGASLSEIGGVLRHRDPNSTLIYTKVALPALHKIARPWPGTMR